ncbi:hypothetical protein FHR23_002524 [Stakelama sediminis]|uniref:Uncharacterized protein n=1 Tax=Stakelama sediminis TaxID=463200 RepID=A0A840Z1I5_9SPHN|nr:hypothetical protein [Stakelama sediminis]
MQIRGSIKRNNPAFSHFPRHKLYGDITLHEINSS